MRRTERTLLHEPFVRKKSGNRVDACHVERFFMRHLRQDAGEGAGKKGLPRTRRTLKQDVVPSGSRDFECALGLLLPTHGGKVGMVCAYCREDVLARRCWFEQRFSRDMTHDRTQRVCRKDANALHKQCFRNVFPCNDDFRNAELLCKKTRGERSRNGSKPSVERKLAQKQTGFRRGIWDVAMRGEDRECDRKI